MTDKPDTSAEALREKARACSADGAVVGRYSNRYAEARYEELAALLRALADEKAAWEYERDALKAQAEVARSYSASGGEGDPRAEGYVSGYNAAVIDIADAYVIDTADAAASPAPGPQTTPPSPAISEE